MPAFESVAEAARGPIEPQATFGFHFPLCGPSTKLRARRIMVR